MLFHAISFAVVLVPGLHRWWSGRRFRNADKDPALAERWWALRTRATQVSLISAFVAAVLSPAWMGLLLPVQWLASAVGGFPARRVVFGESWSLGTYLLWSFRLAAGIWGFWIVLATLPLALPRYVGWGGPLAAALLIAWQHWYGSLVRWSLGATRLDATAISPELAQGFSRVLEASTAPRPDLWRAGPPESMLANAVALPAIRRSSVLFSNALLGALTPAEVTGILAHEMGHIEHYTRQRLLGMSLTSIALIGFATLVLPRLSQGPMKLLASLWPLLLLGTLALRMRWRQEHETASDRRAVELCGDPEALASGLTKLHALGRVPRRWSASVEQRASHPSLARRLAAIRGLAGTPATLEAPVAVQGADGTTWITIEPNLVRHLTGVHGGTPPDPSLLAASAKTALSYSYADIRELRIAAGRSGGTVLTIVGVDGRVRSMPLRHDDVARVQAALDRVDHLLASPTPGEAAPLVISIALSASLAAAGLVFETPTLMALGALTAIVPSPGATLAAALGALVLALGTIGGAPWISQPSISAPAILALALGGLVHAWRWRPVSAIRRAVMLPVMLALATAGVWLVGALLAPNLLTLHRLAATGPATIVGPIALAGALWLLYPRRRMLAVSALILALGAAFVASPVFSHLVVRDPLMASMTPFVARTAAVRAIASGPAPDHALDLRVSPDGRHFAVGIDEDDEGEPSGHFSVGMVGTEATSIAAADVQFLDDRRLLVLTTTDTDATIAMYLLANLSEPLWRHPVAAPFAARLFVNPHSGRWRVSGSTRAQLTRIDGDASGASHVDTWQLTPSDSRQWIVGDGQPLGLKSTPYRRWSRQYLLLLTWDLNIPKYPQSVGLMTRDGIRTLADSDQDVSCPPPAPGRPVFCFASDGATTHVWQFDGNALTPVGELAGDVNPMHMTPDGKLVAWRGYERLLIDAEHRELVVLRKTRGGYEYWSEWTTAGSTIGALVSDADERPLIRTFSLADEAASRRAGPDAPLR
jgi:Zn-dependent protease with chaperone function